ncbi:MAG: sigma-70 family RNA polymerase sigma factor [Actinomycetota bacterium]
MTGHLTGSAETIESEQPAPTPPADRRREERFDDIYRSHRADLVAYAARNNAQDPELVADLALLDGYRALDRLRSDHPRVLWAYLYRALDSHMAREHSKPRPEPLADLEDIGDSYTIEDDVLSPMSVEELIANLPPGQRAALRLRLIENLNAEEVGRVLDKSPNAVRQLQHQGIRQLRRTVYGLVIAAITIGCVYAVLRNTDSTELAPTPAGEPEQTDDEQSTPTTSAPPPLPAPSVEQTTPEVIVGDATFAGVAPAEPTDPATPFFYDGFDLDLSDGDALSLVPAGAGSTGVSDGAWGIVDGRPEILFTAESLQYTDAAGRRLDTAPGALRLRVPEGGAKLRTALDVAAAGDGPVWISYLIRLDSPEPGDAFMRLGSIFDRGSFGIQSRPNYKFVNGPEAQRTVEQGTTVLLVAELRPQGASLWIDPDLAEPGFPAANYDQLPDDLEGTIDLVINDYADARYTVDEIRVGATYAVVTPIAG